MRRGFSMVEILVALMFISFAFLPIYNLFRFGHHGTVSNEREIEATNYASDIINFLRTQKTQIIDQKIPEAATKEFSLTDKEFFTRFQLLADGFAMAPGYTRKLMLKKFNGSDKTGPMGVIGQVSDWWFNRVSVPNYLVHVHVKFPKGLASGHEDEVFLSSIIMD